MADEQFESQEILPPDRQTGAVRPSYPNPVVSPEGYGYGYPEDDERAYLRRAWIAIRKRRMLIAVIIAIVTTIVTVEVFRTKSLFQAAATIEVDSEHSTLVKSGDVVVQSDDSDNTYMVQLAMKSKIRFLESRPVLEDVAATMKLDQDPKFMDVAEKRSVGDALRAIADKARSTASHQSTQTHRQDSGPAALDTDEQRTSDDSARLSPSVDELASIISADPIPDTNMFSIAVTHTDPALAAGIANTLARVFIDRSFEGRTEKYTNATQWLDRTTRDLKAQYEKAEQQLADYTKQHNLMSADGKQTLVSDKLARLNDQAMRASTDRMLKESLYEEVKAGHVAQLPEAFADQKTGALQAKLSELAVTAAQLDAKFGPENPKVVEVKNEMATLQSQINDSMGSLQEKLKADYDRAVRDEKSLGAALDRAKAEAAQENQSTVELGTLKQEAETAQDLYKQFLQKTNQAKIEVAEQHSNLRIIEPARVPVAPIGPDRARTILIGLLSSLLAGCVLALVLDYMDNTIKSVEDLTRYAQLPALGVIPRISPRRITSLKAIVGGGGSERDMGLAKIGPTRSGDSTVFNHGSTVAEAYRSLRTSVLLSTAGGPPKSMLVTSGQPGDGKTTTVINTAVSLAQLGSSVLIIDCDLRKPTTHKMLGVSQALGLSAYLAGHAGLDGLIQKLPIANLSILPCGQIPPNPAELVSSDRMREMLKILSEQYDHILVDSPPLMYVSDGLILSTMVSGVILVVQGGKSTRDLIRRTRHELTNVGAKIFGVVLNNLDVRGNDYYYGRYYSDYGGGSASAAGQ
jgi:succinoglycan biosynthesis transport protein ExoP